MSSSNTEKKSQPTVNLYGILDSELARMHALMLAYLQLPRQDDRYSSGYGGLSNSGSFGSPQNAIPEIYKRILKIQGILLDAVASHDKVIQEKVAELALTGDSNEG